MHPALTHHDVNPKPCQDCGKSGYRERTRRLVPPKGGAARRVCYECAIDQLVGEVTAIKQHLARLELAYAQLELNLMTRLAALLLPGRFR